MPPETIETLRLMKLNGGGKGLLRPRPEGNQL
jgi:hypothetical protein